MKKFIVLLSIVLFFATLKAQTPDDLVIGGCVRDFSGNPLVGLDVFITDSDNPNFELLTSTGKDGCFSVTVKEGSVQGIDKTYYVCVYDCNKEKQCTKVNNRNGSIDKVENLKFSICSANSNCPIEITYEKLSNTKFVFSFPENLIPAGTNYTYKWTFEYTDVKEGRVVEKEFTTEGWKSVCLEIFDPATQCKNQTCINVLVEIPLVCEISFQEEFITENTVKFTPIMPQYTKPYTLLWYLGNGSSSSQLSPTVTYEPGIYTVGVYLTVENLRCDYSKKIIVQPDKIECGAEMSKDKINDNTYYFVGFKKPNNAEANYQWTISDGTTKNTENFTYEFKQPGTYEICLTIFYPEINCEKQVCDKVEIKEQTQCDFELYIEKIQLAYNQFKFEPVHPGLSGEGMTYEWSFGDGSTLFGSASVIHTYNQPGIYLVCLTATTKEGKKCKACYELVVKQQENCKAEIIKEKIGDTKYRFTAVYEPKNVYTKLNWHTSDYGTGTGEVFEYDFKNPGTYNVCLTVYNPAVPCEKQVCESITIEQPTCEVSFEYEYVFYNQVQFKAKHNLGTTGVSYYWTFGNNASSIDENPSVIYDKDGTYKVCLKVTKNNISCEYCKEIVIKKSDCSAMFYDEKQNDNTFSFVPAYPKDNATYTWNFGNGQTSNEKKPTVTFEKGTYEVCLKIETPDGSCVDTYCKTVKVGIIENCYALFYFEKTNEPRTYKFIAQTSPELGDAVYVWEMGDGTTKTGKTFIYKFANYGTYEVCLKVKSSMCETNVYCAPVKVDVSPSDCNSKFTFYQNNNTVKFINEVDEIIGNLTTTYLVWDFGDGNYKNELNPTHTYKNNGTYNVCFTISNGVIGCYDNTTCKEIIIYNAPSCEGDFVYEIGNGTAVTFFGKFSDMSGAVKWQWDFGDGKTSDAQNPTHVFEKAGKYNVCLTIRTPSCEVKKCKEIIIEQATTCVAKFVYEVSNYDVYFKAVGVDYNDKSIKYLWEFGDGTKSELPNPKHTYAANGEYNVCLKITNTQTNCTNTSCQKVKISNNFTVTGVVKAEGELVDKAIAYLLSIVPGTTNNINKLAEAEISNDGKYTFTNIPYGKYLIQVHLSPNSKYFFDFLPTYFGDVINWTFGNFVEVNDNTASYSFDINLKKAFKTEKGEGSISGNIKKEGKGNDVENVLVLLLNENDIPLAYTYSDATGKFEFKELPLGKYKVQAEIWGKEPVASVITLTEENKTVDNIEIKIQQDAVVTTLKPIETLNLTGNLKVYPNPACELVYIETPTNVARITIMNLCGQIVMDITNPEAMNNLITLDINQLSEGVYSLMIQNQNERKVSKLVIVR